MAEYAGDFNDRLSYQNMLNGSVDFIPKPIDPETLIKMIKYHVPLSSPLQQPQLHPTDAFFRSPQIGEMKKL
jgi:FixJ family two-component response regulator